MKKIAMSALMVGALGLASVATTAPAEAHWRGGFLSDRSTPLASALPALVRADAREGSGLFL